MIEPHADEVTPAEEMAGTPARTSILGGSLLIGVSTIVQLGSSLLIGILVARALGAEGKGYLSLLQQFSGIAALVLGLGFGGANAYFVGRKKSSGAEALWDSLAFTAAVSVMGVPLVVAGIRAFVPALDAVSTEVVVMAALTIPFTIASGLVTGILVGQGRIRGQALAQITSAIVAVSLVAALFVSGRATIGVVVLASLIAVTTLTIVTVAQTGVRRVERPSLERLRNRWGYARRSYITTVTGYLEMRQDLLLLGILSSATSVGVYSVAASVAELLWYAPQVTTAPLMARALQEDAASGATVTATITRLIVAMMALATIVLIFILRPVIVAIFGAEFAPASTVFLILAPGIVAVGVSSQLQTYLAAQGLLYPGMTTAMLLLNLGLNVATIPTFGYYGAAAATAISYTLGGSYIVRRFVRETGLPVSDVLMIRGADLQLVSAALRTLGVRRRG